MDMLQHSSAGDELREEKWEEDTRIQLVGNSEEDTMQAASRIPPSHVAVVGLQRRRDLVDSMDEEDKLLVGLHTDMLQDDTKGHREEEA